MSVSCGNCPQLCKLSVSSPAENYTSGSWLMRLPFLFSCSYFLFIITSCFVMFFLLLFRYLIMCKIFFYQIKWWQCTWIEVVEWLLWRPVETLYHFLKLIYCSCKTIINNLLLLSMQARLWRVFGRLQCKCCINPE